MTTPSWNLSIAYQDIHDAKIAQDILLIEQCIDVLEQHVERREAISVMQNAIQTKEAAGKLLSTINTFAQCHASIDAVNQEAKGLVGQIAKLSSQLSQAYTPYQETLANAPLATIQQVLDHDSGDVYGQAFLIACDRQIADTKLSVGQEQLLTAMGVDGRDAWGRLYNNLTGALQIDLEDGTQLGFSQAASLLYGTDFEKQEPAWRGIQKAMQTHQESFAAILNALSGWRLSEYQKRSYATDVHFLDPSLHQSRIQPETLNALIETTKAQREIGQKAGQLMAKVHGLEQMKPWNHLAGMPSLSGDAPETYSFDQAITVIKQAFAEVDQEMADFVDLMVENGWIDAKPTPNRRLGAYCTKFAATRTPLVFMTWGGSRSDLMTLAHELGHAFHNWVMRDMPLCQTRYPMTLAETASIFAENIVRDFLLAKAQTRQEKLEMLWEELSSAYALIVNIPVRFEFEKRFYERRQTGELSAEQLCELMDETWRDWYGDSMSESDPYFWASKLHFSISEVSFYNYPYLFGYLFSKGVYAQREQKGEHFYRDYVQLLRDTGSMMAEEVVERHLGMDLTQPAFWQQSLQMVNEKVTQFEALLAQQDETR
ncbi:M3 family oligoendopeptidase [Vibrio renipiscarius]|uniref:Oligoendopeptidase F n=1 Tax=Vibrio renipiscarius TaxID=1461322 RepID=A0A0C2JD08_9VIBR|nr:M3 family oligoendopeptidase [Vibrio renipiscarius]KII75784.1 oligoendopeptidase F [Vibrio renipiscarius]KII81766.1 oligoendopeptidase F [Vibrio renipiscarius]